MFVILLDISPNQRTALEQGKFELLEETYEYISIQKLENDLFRTQLLPLLSKEDFVLIGKTQYTVILSPETSLVSFLEILQNQKTSIMYQTSVAIFVAWFPESAIDVPGLLVSIYKGLAKRTLSLVCTFTLHTTAYYVVHEEDRDDFLDVFYLVIEDVRDQYELI